MINLNQLNNSQLSIIAENRPEWMAENRLYWMADYKPEWISEKQSIEIPEDILNLIKEES